MKITLEKRIDKLTTEMRKGFKTMGQSMKEGFIEVNKNLERNIEDLAGMVQRQFDIMGEKFDTIDQRFDSIDRKFEGVDRRFDSLEMKFGGQGNRIDALEDNVRIIKTKIGL